MFSNPHSSNSGHTFSQNVSVSVYKVSHYNFSLDDTNAVSMPGFKVNLDDQGQIWGARYETGAELRHNDNYTMIKAANNQMWLGDRHGAFYPLD